MPDYEKLTKALEEHGFTVSRFATAQEASIYINQKLDKTTVGIGGSMTVREMGLYDLIASHNEVFWHWTEGAPADTQEKAARSGVYITSVNGLAETGEIINIDGGGNRVGSTLYGHQRVIFVVGRNKIAPDFDSALRRARNIAGPKNAQRLGRKTPCALRGDKCYDCKSPERICGACVTLWRKPKSIPYAEVVLIDEDLGY